jgi:hypothetical protein
MRKVSRMLQDNADCELLRYLCDAQSLQHSLSAGPLPGKDLQPADGFEVLHQDLTAAAGRMVQAEEDLKPRQQTCLSCQKDLGTSSIGFKHPKSFGRI